MCFVVRFFVIFVVIFVSREAAHAQAADPKVIGTLSNLTRVESWSYFTPPPDAGTDPTYTFIADRAEIGVRVEGVRFDIASAFNYVRLENLPPNAIGPGGLGAGAFYFSASGVSYSYQLYMNELMLRVKTRDQRFALSIGRMHYSSGLESTPTSPALERLKRERLASRLIGDFEWSYYQRRFDGVRVDADRPGWHATGAVLMPTQGGFEESANLTIPKIQLATATFTRKGNPEGLPPPRSTSRTSQEWQAFSYVYRDRRAAVARPDNAGSADGPADVTVAALGGSLAKLLPTRAGQFDVVLWGAGELGDWYGQSQRAASVDIEAGHHWTHATLSPWIRGGYLYASGDGNPNDARHGTFFQMVPSSRQYALSSVYTQMNVKDAFVQAWLEPGRVKARVEAHRVEVANSADLWYHGSGATASTPARFFGFSGRPANGATSLGTVLEGTVDVPIKRYWSINGYAGRMWGGDVVRWSFADTRLTTWFVENVIKF